MASPCGDNACRTQFVTLSALHIVLIGRRAETIRGRALHLVEERCDQGCDPERDADPGYRPQELHPGSRRVGAYGTGTRPGDLRRGSEARNPAIESEWLD